eukprot:Opistho-2@57181
MAAQRLGGNGMRLLLGVIVLSSCVASSFAATVGVTVGPGFSLSFSPSSVTINVGDTVQWTWATGTHNVIQVPNSGSCSPSSGGFASSTQSSGTFSHTFNQAGTFVYVCTLHCGSMEAQITVNAAPAAPTTTAAAAASSTVGAAVSSTVGAAASSTVGAAASSTVGAAASSTVGAAASSTVGAAASSTVGAVVSQSSVTAIAASSTAGAVTSTRTAAAASSTAAAHTTALVDDDGGSGSFCRPQSYAVMLTAAFVLAAWMAA